MSAMQIWNRTWTLMRADPNMAEDVMAGAVQATLKLEPKNRGNTEGFVVASWRFRQRPSMFADLFLAYQGTQLPILAQRGLNHCQSIRRAMTTRGTLLQCAGPQSDTVFHK